MTSDPDKQDITALKFDPEFQTENIAFDLKEMIDCKCGRRNPPNRLNCIYCGNELDICVEDAALIKTNLKTLELWERGYNVILRERVADKPDAKKIAAFLSMDAAELQMILDLGQALPVARVESEKEAVVILNGLSQLGLRCSIVADDDLAADKPPVRLSRIEILEKSYLFIDFNTDSVIEINTDDLVLIVPGILTSGKVDSLEKKRRGKESKLLDETAATFDEAILDIYTRQDANGFRVRCTGFDFSCLGGKKSLLAGENLRTLAIQLKETCPGAKLVSDYSSVKHALGIVWETESRKDSKGMQKVGFGKTEFGTVATTNNLSQFTKYSRLQWHLL